jgi:hypothetical protein
MVTASASSLESPRRPERTFRPSPDLVRRLDWRFLLPDPRLRRVLYVGPADGPLPTALAQLCDRLWIGDSGRPPGVDLVVAERAGRSAVAGALSHLTAGGALYWELPRYGNPFRSDLGWLEGRGFVDIALHWHIPDFESCRQIVPLDDPAAIRFLVHDHIGPAGRRVVGSLCGWLTTANGFWRVLPAISIIALAPPPQTRR